eukprot:2710676-Karenia_brevis.AAC.1
MILARSQFYHSSCIRQALRVHELWHNGALIKVMLPKRKGSGRGFPTMHCKTTVYDGGTVLTGSANITHNAM